MSRGGRGLVFALPVLLHVVVPAPSLAAPRPEGPIAIRRTSGPIVVDGDLAEAA